MLTFLMTNNNNAILTLLMTNNNNVDLVDGTNIDFLIDTQHQWNVDFVAPLSGSTRVIRDGQLPTESTPAERR